MTVCTGCGRNFRGSGYLNHLAHARHPACAAIYSRYTTQQEELPGILDDEEGEEQNQASDNQGEFKGDFYGANYADEDFPGFEEQDSEEEDAEDELEDNWSSSDSEDSEDNQGVDLEDNRGVI